MFQKLLPILTHRFCNVGQKGRYSFEEEEDGIVAMKWQGIYQDFDKSFYAERDDGKKFISLISSENMQVCQLRGS
ncbi:hypothetical protein [Nostoc sp.]|uniref:hypothetical protein n=1 Tax=Nostoc sp. TaxID=1180 RepID=UPI002FFBEC15